jgi:DNA primase
MNKITDLNAAIAAVKEQVPIEKGIGEIHPLTRVSDTMYKALCPFHEEKTPSFTVNPEKGMFYCFGCHVGGDLITFYQQYFTLSAAEAMRRIAEQFHIDISQYERPLTPEEQRIQNLQKGMHKLAILLHEDADPQGFFASRGIDPDQEELEGFLLGYCHDLTQLTIMARDCGLDDIALGELDLQRPAMWTNVAVYPLFDPRGAVIGFKNRPLERGDGPKFIGTTKSPLMDTMATPYGFHIARKSRGRTPLVVVEGQHDVLSAHAAGMPWVVATDGTAFNMDRLQVMQEHGVDELTFAYDGDQPGQEALTRVAQLLNKNRNEVSASVKIAQLPQGKDPDDMIQGGDRLAFELACQSAVYANQYLIDRLAEEVDRVSGLNTVTGKLDYLSRLRPILAAAPAIEQEILQGYLAHQLHLPEAAIEDYLRIDKDAGKQSVLYNLEAERAVLAQVVAEPAFQLEVMPQLRPTDFYSSKYRQLFSIIQGLTQKGIELNLDTVQTALNNAGMRELFGSGLASTLQDSGTGRQLFADLQDKSIRRHLQEIAARLAQQSSNPAINLPVVTEEALQSLQRATDGAEGEGTLAPQTGAKEAMDRVLNNMRHPNQISGIQLQSEPTLTNILRGLNPDRLITLAANQSVGKTTMLTNWMVDMMNSGVPWLHFSLEMGASEMVDKVIQVASGVMGSKILDGTLTDQEYHQVQQAALAYYNSKLFIDDESNTLEAIISKIRQYQYRHQIAGVSIDYVQLMTMERSKARQKYEELGDISGALKRDVAKALNMPVIILSQLSKSAVDKQVATAEDGAGAYKIAQDSDIYMTLKPKNDTEIQEGGGLATAGNMTLFLDKHRQGRADVFIDVMFSRENQRMMEVKQ